MFELEFAATDAILRTKVLKMAAISKLRKQRAWDSAMVSQIGYRKA